MGGNGAAVLSNITLFMMEIHFSITANTLSNVYAHSLIHNISNINSLLWGVAYSTLPQRLSSFPTLSIIARQLVVYSSVVINSSDYSSSYFLRALQLGPCAR